MATDKVTRRLAAILATDVVGYWSRCPPLALELDRMSLIKQLVISLFVTALFAGSSTTAVAASAEAVAREGRRLMAATSVALSHRMLIETAKTRAAANALGPAQRRDLIAVGKLLADGRGDAALKKFRQLITAMPDKLKRSFDFRSLANAVVIEGGKTSKAALSARLRIVRKIHNERRRIQERLTRAGAKENVAELERTLATWGDDAAMNQLELQEMLNKHAEMLQILSSVMKVWNEAIKSIIANFK